MNEKSFAGELLKNYLDILQHNTIQMVGRETRDEVSRGFIDKGTVSLLPL